MLLLYISPTHRWCNACIWMKHLINKSENAAVSFVGRYPVPVETPPAVAFARGTPYMEKQRSRAKDTELARASRSLRGDEPEVENLRWRARRLEIPRACFRFIVPCATSRGIVPWERAMPPTRCLDRSQGGGIPTCRNRSTSGDMNTPPAMNTLGRC